MKRAIAIVAVILLVAGCSSKANNASGQDAGTSANLTVSATFNPDPPKQGSEAITVTVKDASGAPVKGAVVKISTTMPSMSMTGPSTAATDNGDGTYSASMSLQYATSWHFTIEATSDGKTARSELVENVK